MSLPTTLAMAEDVAVLFDVSSSALPSNPNPYGVMGEVAQAVDALLAGQPPDARLWQPQGSTAIPPEALPTGPLWTAGDTLVLLGFGGADPGNCTRPFPELPIVATPDTPGATGQLRDFYFEAFRRALDPTERPNLRDGFEAPDLAKWQASQRLATAGPRLHYQITVTDGVHFGAGTCRNDPDLARRRQAFAADYREQPLSTWAYTGQRDLRIVISRITPRGVASCAKDQAFIDGRCQTCGEGFAPNASGLACVCPSDNVDAAGVCQPCAVGFTLGSDGQCVPFVSFLDPSIADELPSADELAAAREERAPPVASPPAPTVTAPAVDLGAMGNDGDLDAATPFPAAPAAAPP
ncbi:MAG: hypothetical protein ACFCBW_19745, partial [Candidatus Competibacterales bacterium]